MSDPIRQAALAAAQSLQSQAPAPQPPATPPAAPPPQGGQPPAAPQAPAPTSPVAYVPPTGLARAVVDGKPIDVPVSELVAKYQIGSAAEQRLAQANAMRNEHRAALETHQRLASLARTDPRAFQEEAHKAFGLRPAATAENPNSARTDPNEAPETTALRQEVAELRAAYQDLNQFRGNVVMQTIAGQVRGAIAQFPLYQQNPVAAQRAESLVATYLANNQGASPAEVVGMVHAQDIEFLQSATQQVRDQRAGAAQQFATVPASAGTPQLSVPEMPRMTQEQMRKGSHSVLKAVATDIKRMAGL